MNNTNKETQLLYIQVYASILFIITILVSTILTYNNILKQKNEQKLFKQKTENQINFINRLIITILAIVFTYINYNFYQINRQKNNETIQKDEFIASVLTLAAGIILFYTTIESIKNNTNSPNIENPLI